MTDYALYCVVHRSLFSQQQQQRVSTIVGIGNSNNLVAVRLFTVRSLRSAVHVAEGWWRDAPATRFFVFVSGLPFMQPKRWQI